MKIIQKSVYAAFFCSCVLLSQNSKRFDPKYPTFLSYNIFTLTKPAAFKIMVGQQPLTIVIGFVTTEKLC